MLRKLIAISFLFAFTVLQYGKMLSYLYCELQVEISNKPVLKCDCEKIISAHYETSSPASLPQPHTHKDKLNEPFIADDEISTDKFEKIITSCFIYQTPSLQNGFENPPFHPPALLS